MTNWIREILDNAQNVEEAVEICKNLRVYDGLDKISHHILILDAEGNYVTVEFNDDDWVFIYDDKPWEVVTNTILYNKTPEEEKQICWRYKKAYNLLEEQQGMGDWQYAMHILLEVSQGYGIGAGTTGTLWSFAADINNRWMYLCIRSEYDQVYTFDLK